MTVVAKPSVARRMRRFLCLGIAGPLMAIPAASSHAAVIESFSILSSYGYRAGSNAVDVEIQPGGNSEQVFVPFSDGSKSSELGIVYNATAGNGGFFFLHQNYCVGTCSTFSQSVVTINLENTGSEAVDLRFDSQITPGHLALKSGTRGVDAQYAFSVAQAIGGGAATSLYNSTGTIIQDGAFLDTGGLTFTGQASNSVPKVAGEVIDWGATNLNVPLLRLEAGASSVLTYSATYYVRNDGVCDVLADCSSAEIVFGDPRRDGGVVIGQRTFAAVAEELTKPMIGGVYAPYFVPISVVPIDDPLPSYPVEKTAVSYTADFTTRVPSAVPEPATWMIMIVGFGAIGISMRRGRKPFTYGLRERLNGGLATS
jgi:hypothetical protein